MTDEIELLPLPAEDYVDDEGLWEKRYGPYSSEQMEDYARANVLHHTAPLQAEIERLRAEVERLRTDGASAVRWAPSSAYWSDVLVELFGPDARKGIDVLERRWQAALERAEQLEEALRGWWMSRRPVGWTEDQHRSSPHVNLVTGAEKALADAMLREQRQPDDTALLRQALEELKAENERLAQALRDQEEGQ